MVVSWVLRCQVREWHVPCLYRDPGRAHALAHPLHNRALHAADDIVPAGELRPYRGQAIKMTHFTLYLLVFQAARAATNNDRALNVDALITN